MRSRRKLFIILLAMVFIVQAWSIPMLTFAGVSGEKTEVQINDVIPEMHWFPDLSEMPDNDELFLAYVENAFSVDKEKPAFPVESTLAENFVVKTNFERAFYNAVSETAPKIANGTITSTKIPIPDITWTYAELGVTKDSSHNDIVYAVYDKYLEEYNSGFRRVIMGVMADMPYNLYWFDKTSGFGTSSVSFAYDNTKEIGKAIGVELLLSVTQDYIGTAQYTTDKAKTSVTYTAVSNAKNIVNKFKDKSDLGKLRAYNDEICSLVEYDDAAAENSNTWPYGNSFQLINVFDNNTATNVVCEGYSKAFQYLCDLSTFKSSVKCYTVSGNMSGATGAGGHMWNVVSIYGGNYLVDVTNCDQGTIGNPDKLLLVGVQGQNNGQTHVFNVYGRSIPYTYKDEMKDLFCTGFLELTPGTPQEPLHEPVTSITMTNARSFKAGEKLTLEATVAPQNATNKDIKWSIDTDGGTNASLSGSVLTAEKAGTVTVRATVVNGKTETTDFTETFNITVIGAAAVVTKGNDPVTGKPKLTWEPVPGAAKYEIYRSDSAAGTYVMLTTTTGTTFMNTSAVAGKTYYYKVKVIPASASAASSTTAAISVTCKYPTPKVTGSNNVATGKNVLKWEAVPGAAKYEVYRYDSASSAYVKMITTASTTLTHSSAVAGKTYAYKVKAVGSVAAATSAASSTVKVTCKYPAPKVAGSNTATGKPKLTWEKVEGATKYEVYMYDSASAAYVKLITTASTTLTHSSAVAGKTYAYKVRAIGSVAAAASGYSNVVKLTCKCEAPKVTGSTNPTTGKPKLTWDKVEGASKYEVYRYDSIKKIYVKIATTTYTSITNTSAQSGVTYYYKVKAIGATTASDSALSTSVKITCK